MVQKLKGQSVISGGLLCRYQNMVNLPKHGKSSKTRSWSRGVGGFLKGELSAVCNGMLKVSAPYKINNVASCQYSIEQLMLMENERSSVEYPPLPMPICSTSPVEECTHNNHENNLPSTLKEFTASHVHCYLIKGWRRFYASLGAPKADFCILYT